MKENELREHTTCTICNRLIGHTGLYSFWTVTIEQHGINIDAVRRQDGLAQMLGSTRLAQVMGTDAEMTETMLESVTLTICEICATDDTSIDSLAKFSPNYPHPAPPF